MNIAADRTHDALLNHPNHPEKPTMMTTNDKALVFAKAFSQLGTGNTLHVYVDGVVLFIEGGSDRHLAVRRSGSRPMRSRTRSGFGSQSIANC